MLDLLHSEIITYMSQVLVKNDLPEISAYEEYFNVKVQNKKYPSCYHYNILVMLAKRLVKEDQENLVS